MSTKRRIEKINIKWVVLILWHDQVRFFFKNCMFSLLSLYCASFSNIPLTNSGAFFFAGYVRTSRSTCQLCINSNHSIKIILVISKDDKKSILQYLNLNDVKETFLIMESMSNVIITWVLNCSFGKRSFLADSFPSWYFFFKIE